MGRRPAEARLAAGAGLAAAPQSAPQPAASRPHRSAAPRPAPHAGSTARRAPAQPAATRRVSSRAARSSRASRHGRSRTSSKPAAARRTFHRVREASRNERLGLPLPRCFLPPSSRRRCSPRTSRTRWSCTAPTSSRTRSRSASRSWPYRPTTSTPTSSWGGATFGCSSTRTRSPAGAEGAGHQPERSAGRPDHRGSRRVPRQDRRRPQEPAAVRGAPAGRGPDRRACTG